MAIDLKSYYEKNRAYYGDVPLEKVAQDVYTRSAEKQPYDQWLGSTGIQGQIEEDNYQRSVQTARNQDIGLVKEFGRGLVRGVTQSLPQAVGQGVQWLNPDQGGSDTLETLGKSIETFGNENARKLPEYSPSKKVDTSFWHRAAANAGESTPASLAPFAVGSLTSAVAGPVAGVAAGAASMIPTFYGATAEQKYREGEQAGLSPEKNMLNANIAGASEVITEGLSDLVPYALFGKLTAPAKGALLKGLTEGKPFTQILKDVLATGAAETSTEALNVGIQAASDKYAGLESKQNVGSDALDAAGSAAIMTLVFSAVGIPFDAYHRSSIRKTLADPTADPKKTMTAINEVATAAAEHDPQLAELFADRAVKLAAAGKPIVIDDDEAYRSSPWAPPTKTVVDPAEKAKSIILLAKSNIPDEDLDKLTADPVTLRQYGLEPTDIAIAKQEREAVKSIVGAHQAEIDAAPSEPVKQGMIAALNKDIETSAITRVTKALKAQVEVESAAEPKGIDTSEAVTPQSILADTTALRQSNRQVDLKNFVDKYGLSAYSYAMRTTPETFKISDFMSQVADRYAETTGKPTPNLSPEDIKARETLVSTLNAKSTYGEVKSVAEALGVPLTVETDGKVTSIGKKKLLAKVRDQAFLDRLSEPETTTPTTASTTASTTALARAATAPAAAPVLAPTENTKGIPIKGLTPTRIKELAKEHGITETAGPKIIRELVSRGIVASPTSKPIEVPTGKKGIIALVEGKDLTKIAESAIVAFPDIPESTEGVLPLSRFLPDEQESLRNAGIVETVTTAKGQAYEGVNPEYLWERRKQIQAGSEPKKTQPVLLREFAAKHGIDTSLPDMVIKAELAKRKIGIPAEIANTGLVSNPDLREAIAIEGAKTDTTKVSDKDLLSHAEKDAYIPVDADLKWVDKSKLRRVAETRGIDHTGMSRKQLIAALKLPAQAKDSKAQAKAQSTVQPTVSQKITTKLDFMGRKELSEAAAFAGIPVKKKDKADTIAKKLTKAGITEVVRDETDKVIGVNKTEKAAPETKPEIKPGIESVDMLRRTELVKIAEQVGIKTGHKNASDITKALKARSVSVVQRNADGSHSLVTEPKPKVKAKEVKSNAKSKEAETLLTPTSTEDQDMTRPQLMIQQGRAASSKTDRGKLEELAKWFEVPTRRKNVLRSSTAVAKDIREAAENAANPTLTPEKLEAARNLSIVEATKEQITHFAELFNVPVEANGKPRGKTQIVLEIRKAANEYKLKDTPQIIEQRKRALGKLEKMPNIPPAQVKAVKHLLEGGTITTSVETTGKRQSDQGFTNRSLRAAENKGLIKQDPTTGKWRVTIDDIAVGKRDVTEIPATPEEIDVLLNSHGMARPHEASVLSLNKGEHFRSSAGDSYVDYEVMPDGSVVLHDVWTDESQRNQGVATRLIKGIIEEHPDATIWTGAVSPGMDKISKNLGFKLYREKQTNAANTPKSVDYSNANVWVRPGKNYNPEEVPKFAVGSTSNPMSVDQVHAEIQNFLKTKHTPKFIKVIQHFEELPQALQDVYGPTPFEGITYKGTVYLIADNIKNSVGTLRGILTHEGGHLLLAADTVWAKRWKQVLDSLKNQTEFSLEDRALLNRAMKQVEEVRKNNYAMTDEMAQEEQMMYYLGYIAEEQASEQALEKKYSLYSKIKKWVRDVLIRFMGFSAEKIGMTLTARDITMMIHKDLMRAATKPLVSTDSQISTPAKINAMSRFEEEFIKGKGPKAATATEWTKTLKSWIDKSMPNPVKEELYWSGILEWLDGKEGKITRDNILDFLKYNGLKSQVNVKITTDAVLPHESIGTDPWLHEMLPDASNGLKSRETLVSLYKAGAIPDTEEGLKAQTAAEVLLKYPNQELEPLYGPWDTARENLLKVFPGVKDTTRDILYSNTWEMVNDPINWRQHFLHGLPDVEHAKIDKMLEVPQVQQAVQDFLREAVIIREDEHALYSYMDANDSNNDARLEAEKRDLDLHRRVTVNWSSYAIVKPNRAAETFNIEINIPEHTKDIPVYTSPHYNKTPNQLVSARVQVLDTGELFINEIQSDLHQRESTLHTGLPFKTNYITVALKEIIKEAVKRNVHTVVWPSSPVQVRKIENWDPIMVYSTADDAWEDLLGEAKSGSVNQTTRNIGASIKRNILKYGGKLGTVTLDDIKIELQTNPTDSVHAVSGGFLIGTLSDDYNASVAEAHERVLSDLEAQGVEVYAEEVHQVTWPGIVTKIPHIFATKAEAEIALKQIQETDTADFVMEYNALAITPELAALASEGKLPMASVPEHRSADEILKDVFGDRPNSPDEAISAFRADRITSSDSIAQRAKDPDVRAVGKLMANILRSTLGFVHSAQNETAPKKKKKGIAGVNKYERTKDTQTTNIFTRLFSLPEYYMRKDSTAERVLEHALAQSDIKYLAEKSILGETFLDTLDRVRKDKTSYDQAKKYLLETDRTGVGYSISFYKGAWNVFSPLGKVILTYKTEEEAVTALVEQEQVDLRARKFSDNALAMVKEVRDLTNRGFDLLAADMRRQIKLAKDNGLAEPTTKHINNKGKEETISLSEAIALMGDLRGTYFPRERPQKNYVVTAQKPGLLGKKELIPVNLFLPGNTEQHPFRGKIKDFINQHLPVKKVVDSLLAKGYTEEEISINPVKSVSDEIFDVPGLLTATDSLLAAAIENTEREDMSETEVNLLQNITQKLTQNIGNIYKAKGSFSSRVKRADAYWEGYEEDPQKALTSYAQRLAAGVARRTTARGMLEAFTGRDISWAQFRKDNPTAKYKDYRAEVKRRAISAITQKNLYDDVRLYMTHVLRPDSAVDRFVGYLKGLSILSFLGFRVSSAAVNMTNMAMAVPATISAHTGLSLTKSWSEITSAAAKYAKFRAGRLEKTGVISSAFRDHLGKLALSSEDEALFNMIARNGWDEAQFNQDSVRVLQDTLSEGWNKTMAAAMFMFGAAERANRAITIFAAAKAYMKADPKMSVATALKKAHYTSNRAHGQYGKGAKPWLIQKVRFLDLPYTFFKFQQNYMLNMLELGVKYGSWKNAAYMLMSPAVLSGAGASLLMPVVAAALKATGSDDPEEEFYSWAENTFGSDTFARHGLAGLLGVNLKGSLEINSPFPDLTKGWLGAMGAPGGVFINLADAINKFSEGQYLKGTEKLLPSAAGSVVKGYREYTEGVSTETYAPVFVGTERLMGTPMDFATRLFSFNPERISGIRQQQWREDQVRLEYQKLRTKITTGFNHLLENPTEVSQDDYASLYQKIIDYNNRVAEADPKYQIPYITPKWLNASIKRSQTPDKYERNRK